MSNDEQFQKAAEDVKQLPKRPDNDQLLRLYALYKQGSEGDVTGSRPGMLDFKGRAKFDAWAKIKGTDSETAKTQYVEFVKQLQAGS